MANIIFDLGNVLIRFQPQDYMRRFVAPQWHEAFYHTVFASPQWLALDRGTLDYAQAQLIFKQNLPECEAQISALFEVHLLELLTPIWPNIAVLTQLAQAKTHRLFILSNFHRQALAMLKQKYDFFGLFDGETISSDCQFLKPEPEIYQQLLSTFSLDAAHTFFIDDMSENIAQAQRFGIHGIHLPEPDLLREKLTACGLLLNVEF
jgi:putative hydrolase of the HAD superfamily